jgi:hypothetical protein
MNYTEIRSINVSTHIEKKNGLSYLSWAWAVDQLLLLDSDAFGNTESLEGLEKRLWSSAQ